MIFSKHYAAAIRNGKLEVALPDALRQKIAETMAMHNHAIGVRRNPDDPWIDHTDVISEIGYDLAQRYGAVRSSDVAVNFVDAQRRLLELIMSGPGENVLDAIEMMWSLLLEARRNEFAGGINALLEVGDAPSRIVRGEFIRLDNAFTGSSVTRSALERIGAGPLAGATAEYAKALREQASGETKDAIADACKSCESTLKVVTGLGQINADRLTRELLAQGHLNDLPEDAREGFREVVLMSLPFLRNRLAGHGQGAEVVDVPAPYGALALQLAAALQNFLISKFAEMQPSEPPRSQPDALFDESPF